MANKVLARFEGLAIPATFAAVLTKGDNVKISANETIAIAGAGDKPLGQVVKSPAAANGIGTIETRFRALIEIVGNGILAAGAEVKLSSVSGGNQRVAAFTEGTDLVEGDAEPLRFGRVWKGGADGATIKVLVY